MRTMTLVIVSLSFILLFVCSRPFYAAEPLLDGHWEGAIAQPAGDLKMTVDFVTQGDVVRGTFTMPAVGAFKWPVKISGDAPRVKFALPTGLAFEGELQGDTISGRVPSPTGGHVDPFLLRRTTARTLPYTEEEVRFQSGGVTLVGVLRLPLTKEKHPALFLLQGSGPVDRDGESFYADAFARAGIATLLYDKPGVGRSGATSESRASLTRRRTPWPVFITSRAVAKSTQSEWACTVEAMAASSLPWPLPCQKMSRS